MRTLLPDPPGAEFEQLLDVRGGSPVVKGTRVHAGERVQSPRAGRVRLWFDEDWVFVTNNDGDFRALTRRFVRPWL